MASASKQAVRRKTGERPLPVQVSRGVREALLLALLALALFLLLALASYDRADPAWSHTGLGHGALHNYGGLVGAWFADIAFYVFGGLAWLAPVMVGYSGWLLFSGQDEDGRLDFSLLGLRWLGFVVTVLAGCGLAALHFSAPQLPMDAGGLLGLGLSDLLRGALGPAGATLFLLAAFLGGFTLFTGLSWLTVLDLTGMATLRLWAWARQGAVRLAEGAGVLRERWTAWRAARAAAPAASAAPEVPAAEAPPPAPDRPKKKGRRKARVEPTVPDKPTVSERQMPLFQLPAVPTPEGLPGIELLDPPVAQDAGYSAEALQDLSEQVELRLADFGVEAKVESVHPGPVVTRFELMLAPGTKVSKITGLAKDLARALAVISVRVVEIIPGRPTIGLEIPNRHREMVYLSEIIAAKAYQKASSPLTLALGKDIGGAPVVADVAKMPHLLVAGTTGSGKSVAVNAMLLSVLFKARPDEVRMILIDPKMLELSVYEGIPHLLTPVVTDMKDAANALRWCVAEMERRYQLMSALGVRNMNGYNRKVREARERGEPLTDPLWQPTGLVEGETAPELEPMPYILIVVDEFADMMMVVGKKVEELIARLAQKARAAGLHLILATQRPSVDVITGLIKANIPSRIAFQVSSKVDSRTILDQMGAEQLLGHGDMLYLPGGTSIPTRVHGAFVADHEVHQVCDYLRAQGEPDYVEEVTQEAEPGEAAIPGLEPVDEGGGESDPLYDQAVAIVTESRKASISWVQRRLKIGYNRAARIVEEMEAAGVVSPVQANGSREVLAPPPPEM